MEVANEFKEERPDRYNELANKAKDDRAEAIDDLLGESERSRAASDLETARANARAKYPRITDMPGAFAGATPTEIEANAKAASDFVEKREKEVAEAGRLARRGRVAEAFSPSGRAMVPASEIGQESGQGEVAAAAAGRLAKMREVAGTPSGADGAREFGVAGKGSSNEEAVITDLRRAGRMRGADATLSGQGPRGGGGDLDTEDRRG
jgi:hypothetical protein